MLAANHESVIAPQLNDLPMLIELPDHLTDFMNGPIGNQFFYDERRAYVRKSVRHFAVLELEQTLGFISNRNRFTKIILKDISVQGIGFLNHEQLFPNEVFSLSFGEKKIRYRIARCRKIANKCFIVGASLVSGS